MVNTAVTDTAWSPNIRRGRPGDPQFIVIHHWGGDGQNHQRVVNLLCDPSYSLSAHYVASAGRVTQLVHDYDRAQHAGPNGNPYGIGIECRPEMSPGDFETVARLIAAIRAEWGPLPLRGHCDILPTACPGRWYPRLGDLSARADAINRGERAPSSIESSMTPLERTITEMKATHILFQHGNNIGIANILAGTYWLAPNPRALEDRKHILFSSGAKLVEWRTLGHPNNEIKSLAALGVPEGNTK